MTKYVMNSGGVGGSVDEGKAFYREIVDGLGDRPRILLCFFSKPREVWEETFIKYQRGFAVHIDSNPQFELAMPDEFVNQVGRCDAIYMYGGDDHLAMYWLSKFDLAEIFKDKVVATNSASSDAVSTHFWTCDWRELKDGLGILPIKFLPHYKSNYGDDDTRGSIDWTKAYSELQAYGDVSLPIYALEEGDFVVINQP